jgi:hypothetical protein
LKNNLKEKYGRLLHIDIDIFTFHLFFNQININHLILKIMALYQPQQDLTWKYIKNTGQLIIVATIRVDLGSGEHLNHSFISAINNTFLVSLNVVSGINNTPVEIDIPYANITSGLSDTELVRQIIATIASATIQTTVYKSGAIQGSVVGATNTTAGITIV